MFRSGKGPPETSPLFSHPKDFLFQQSKKLTTFKAVLTFSGSDTVFDVSDLLVVFFAVVGSFISGFLT